MNLLRTLGLMTRAEHDALAERFSDLSMANCDARAELAATEALLIERENELAEERAKFKRAATDLAAQAEEIAQMKVDMSRAAEAADNYLNWIAGLEAEVQALRPDAEAMRKKRAADRKRIAGKRGKDNG